MRILWLAAMLPLALLRTGCGQSPTAPSPSPTPTPAGKANATALENLPLIRSLERATGRGGMLIGITGITSQAGTVPSGEGWLYVFAQPLPDRRPRLYVWSVGSSGDIGFGDDIADTGRREYVETGPSLAFDTPEAVRRGREYGAQPFVDRYPGALVRMGTRSVGGRVIWEISFFDQSPGSPSCSVLVVIDALTGESLERDLSCLQAR